MAWGSKRQPSNLATNEIENVLGKSLRVRGDMKAEGAFRIDGTVEGAVESAGTVIIGEDGRVHGNVLGREIVIAGKVHGNVTARGHLDILASGCIEGDFDAKSFLIETGGTFKGTSRMGEKPVEDVALSAAHLSAIK
jgi:cytoskeletal protein CcmA (bactofilin family)